MEKIIEEIGEKNLIKYITDMLADFKSRNIISEKELSIYTDTVFQGMYNVDMDTCKQTFIFIYTDLLNKEQKI